MFLALHESCADDSVAYSIFFSLRIGRIMVGIRAYRNIGLPNRAIWIIAWEIQAHFNAMDLFQLSIAWGEEISFTFL